MCAFCNLQFSNSSSGNSLRWGYTSTNTCYIIRFMHQKSFQGSHTESSLSAKTWLFELSLNFWIEIDIGYNILKNNKNLQNLWREFKELTSRTPVFFTWVHVVNFEIPAHSCMKCFHFLCFSRYQFLSKKFKLSWNSQVLAENELSLWDPWSNFWCIKRII